MDEQDFQHLVLHYLRARGFKDAEAAFQRGAKLDESAMALTDRLSVQKGVAEQLVKSFQLESDPSTTVAAFERLAKWVDASLDLHKLELVKLLYPVFTHCYLDLISKDAPTQAILLFDKFSVQLADMAGPVSQSRARELTELRNITGKQQLSSSTLAKQVASTHHTLRLSSYAQDLLLHFLHTHPLMLQIAGIINQHITIKVVDRRPGQAADAEDEPDGMQAAEGEAEELGASLQGASILATNQQPIRLQLLKGNAEDRFAEQEDAKLQPASAQPAPEAAGAAGAGDVDMEGAGDEAAGAEGEADAATGAAVGPDGKPAPGAKPDGTSTAGGGEAGDGAAGGAGGPSAPTLTRKQQKDANKQAAQKLEAELKARRDARTHRLEPPWWMGQPSDATHAAWLADVAARAPVSTAQLPSCCCFTFANTRQTLTCATFLPDVSLVAAGFSDSSVRVYNVEQLASKASSKGAAARQPHKAAASSGPAAASQKAGAAGGSAGAASGMHKPAGAQTGAGEDGDEDGVQGVTYMYGHTGPLHAVDFTHDARMLLSASADGSVRLWGSDVGACLAVYRGHLMPVWDVAASPWGYHFASAGADRTARIWATDTTHTLRVLAGHQADVDFVRWHPNCHYVATASSDRILKLWDVATGSCVRILSGLQAAPTSLALSPDGKQVSAGDAEGGITMWDLGSARRLAVLSGHIGPVWSLSYSFADGAVLASGGADETVRLWSTNVALPASAMAAKGAAKPAEIRAFTTKASAVTHVQFSRRNLLLAAGSFQLRKA